MQVIKKILNYYKTSNLVKSRYFNYIPLNLSKKRDEEKIHVKWHDSDSEKDIQPASRRLTKDQSIALWRLYWHSFSHPDFIFDDSSSISNMVPCALLQNLSVTHIRFRYCYIEKAIVSSPNNEVYAIDLESKKIFELKEAQSFCWYSPTRAIITLLTKENWWRDWTTKDTEIALQNQLRSCSS